MNPKQILITGGCGYIGSHTIIELLEKTDFELISVDNLSNSSLDTLARIKQITGKSVKNLHIELCNRTATETIFQQFPNVVGIIHFAALKSVPESVAKPLLYYHNNIESLVNLLYCCEKYAVKNFIFSSSCSVYGNVSQLPVNEETTLQKAESPYAYTKQIGEVMLNDFVKKADIQAIALRYFNPVGSHITGLNGENPVNPPTSLVPVITRTAIGLQKSFTVFGSDYDTRDGSALRDYVHVTDIAEAHVLALNHLLEGKNTQNFDVFNLGSGEGVTVLEAIKAFIAVSGITPTYHIGERRAGDIPAIYSDTTKSEKILHWKPKLGIKEMMDSAWKWQIEAAKPIHGK
jgi:UDP-glucose 4-epimerase